MSYAQDLKIRKVSLYNFELFQVRFGIYNLDKFISDLKIYVSKIGSTKIYSYIVLIVVSQKRQHIRCRKFCPISQKITLEVYVFKITICYNSIHRIFLTNEGTLRYKLLYADMTYSLFSGRVFRTLQSHPFN